MPRILILSTTTGYQLRSFGDAAADLGFELVFATDRCHQIDDPWRDSAVAVRFHDEAASVAAIASAAARRPIDGLIAVGDRPVPLAALTAEALRLRWHHISAAATSANKQLARERWAAAGMPVPAFVLLEAGQRADWALQRLSLPVVVKPLGLSGSRGVIRADTPADLTAAADRVRRLLARPDVRAQRTGLEDTILVETFIPGREYAIEGILSGGRLQTFAMFDKPDPLDGPFFEETIYLTPSTYPLAVQHRIIDGVARAAAAIGLYHGPIHAECRIDVAGGKVPDAYVLEVAARPIGGLCAKALRFHPVAADTPVISLENLLIRHALGQDATRWTREAAASGVMMIPIPQRGVLRDVSGLEAAQQVPHVDGVHITAKLDQVLVPLPEGASYLGFIFARADRAADVDRSLRAAHASLGFAFDPEVPVLQSQHG
jgi:biotin carboxylase